VQCGKDGCTPSKLLTTGVYVDRGPDLWAHVAGLERKSYKVHGNIVETLYGRQYWQQSWKPDFPPCRLFELGDPSYLEGPRVDCLFDIEFTPSDSIYLNEIDTIHKSISSKNVFDNHFTKTSEPFIAAVSQHCISLIAGAQFWKKIYAMPTEDP